MLKFFATILLVLSFNVNADEKQEKSKESLSEVKSRITQNLDKRIAQLQENKSCVNAAQDREALKNCREKSKEKMQALQKEWKEFRASKNKK